MKAEQVACCVVIYLKKIKINILIPQTYRLKLILSREYVAKPFRRKYQEIVYFTLIHFAEFSNCHAYVMLNFVKLIF